MPSPDPAVPHRLAGPDFIRLTDDIDQEKLSVQNRYVLAILLNLPKEKLALLEGWRDRAVVAPPSLKNFRELLEGYGFDLSEAGVSAFKDHHKLGNTGAWRAVIGPQTASVYHDELVRQVAEKKRLAIGRKLLAITGAFEGRGFANVAGNFDGQGLSFGILQWNFGQGSLPPLLQQMYGRDPETFSSIFAGDTGRFLKILGAGRTTQMEFARSINDSRKSIIEPWKSRFIRLGNHPTFQEVQVKFAGQILQKAKMLALSYGLQTERGLSLMFDILVQNGSIRPSNREAIMQSRQEQEQALGRPLTELEFLEIIAVKRSEDASARWRDNVLARKLAIARGTGLVHGRVWDLAAEFGLGDELWT